ncbi:LIP-domain-containing protein [Aspergillus campestris IBT 28561]|uniref:LIP-domain-containing protein n=1 Tax=Aspergillus campestris (strain IBT 28561) TaxID=1392248 RepID=A0A2I1CWL4_ASPC2|nr:LIP-domain-containing protein [Aspergillus campestris IBT 28561]PKY02005.1 LIP-domain-containing protein [Aspergillus campestris IBT 28561]
MVSFKVVLLQALAYLLPLAAGFPAPRADGPLKPVDDPFYVPPAGFESEAPGTILRHRKTPFPIAAFGFAKVNLESSHQVLYRTTDAFGKAVATVSTILIPHNADTSKLLSYQVAQDAADPNCSPSFAFQQESENGNALSLIMPQLEFIFITAALNKGWVVTAPDHLGPESAFLSNILSGHAVLDNIRAVLASTEFTNVTSDATVTMWGYSGGSLASGFAAELQPEYAPELKIAGAALGGTVPEILPVVEATNKGLFTGLLPAGIRGLSKVYPEIAKLIDENLIPEKREEFQKTDNLCLTGNILEYLGKDVYSYVKNEDVFSDPIATKVLNENAMGHNIPGIPLFIYKSAGDEVSPVNASDALVDKYCDGGAQLEYKRDTLSEHALLEIVGAPDAFFWLEDRMDGAPAEKGCKRSTHFTTLADPRTIAALGSGLVQVLLSFLSLPIGPPL